MDRLINFIKKIVNNDYLFSVIAKVVGLFITILLSVLVARFFGAELKGVSTTVENDVTLYAIFIGLGIYQAYPFFRKKEPEIYSSYINNISSLFFIYEVIACLIAGFMIYRSINVLLAVAIILMPIEAYIKQLNYIVLIENPRRRNASSLIISCSEIVVVLFIWIFFSPTRVTVVAYYCSFLALNLILSFINLRYNPFKIRFAVNRLGEFIRFGFVPMLVYLCMTINYKIDVQMLKWFESSSDVVTYASIGVYATGIALATKIWLIPDAIKDILLSKLVKGKGEDEVARVIRISLLVCVMSMVVFIVIGKPAILLLYGRQFEDAYLVMVLMMMGVISMIFYKMIYSYNIAQGKRTINLIFLGSAAVVNFIGNYFLIPVIGIWGAVTMSIVSYSLCGICFAIYFHKVSGIPYKKMIIVQKDDFRLIQNFLKR